MRYSELTLRYFESAPNAGVLEGAGCFRGAAGGRTQGTWVQFDVRPAGGYGSTAIQEARFLAFGCPHVIAVSAWVAERAAGVPLRERLPESVPALRERFGVPVEKLGRLLVIEDAWIAAMRSAERGVQIAEPHH
jgi:hypothetical protein